MRVVSRVHAFLFRRRNVTLRHHQLLMVVHMAWNNRARDRFDLRKGARAPRSEQ